MFEALFSRNGLSLDRLRSLVEVDEAGGIAKAAPDDPVRQSQISKNLAQLETFFGTELKRRKGKGIELTEAGRKLARLARTQLLTLDSFAREARDQTGRIRIGGGMSAIEWCLLPTLAGLEGDFRFELTSMRSQEVIRRIDDFSLDIGLVRRSAVHSKQFRVQPVTTVRYALFVDRRLTERVGRDPAALLSTVPLATSMGGEFRRRLEEYAGKKGIQPDVRFSCSSFRTALETVKRNPELGGLLPGTAAAEFPEAEFAEIPLPFLDDYRRELVLVWKERILDIRPVVGSLLSRLA